MNNLSKIIKTSTIPPTKKDKTKQYSLNYYLLLSIVCDTTPRKLLESAENKFLIGKD